MKSRGRSKALLIKIRSIELSSKPKAASLVGPNWASRIQAKAFAKSYLRRSRWLPQNSLYRDDLFDKTCEKLQDRNEARVVDKQLKRLEPFVGGLTDTSFFMATYYMYFPFLTCEIKCGAAASILKTDRMLIA